MKYLKYFESNVEIDSDIYIKSLNDEEFQSLLNENCKEFDFDDKPLIRGDKKIHGKYYYINGKNRKVDYTWAMMFPFHLEFMKSDKWNGLPKKDKSIDLVTYDNTHISSGFYGTVYRVIPYDGATFAANDIMVGNRNKILYEELGIRFLSNLSDSLVRYHNKYFDRTFDTKEFTDHLDVLFGNGKGLDKEDNIINSLFLILNEKNKTFREYMEYAFSPESYEIMNYKDLIKSNGLYVWTDSPVLLLPKYKRI
jgi:hypothetical protein